MYNCYCLLHINTTAVSLQMGIRIPTYISKTVVGGKVRILQRRTFRNSSLAS